MTRKDSKLVQKKAVQIGSYRFTGKILGKGSFAVVEEAVHNRLKVKVAVKIINLLKSKSYVLRNLRREANILQKLNHPHIMQLFETMKYGSMYCLVTELIHGGDLCTFVQQQQGMPLDEKTARKISRQITTAIEHLHSKGIVHRDLKLENIMMDSRKENIKIIDFGLSNSWRADSPLKTLCGSPEYCAPELFVCGAQYGPQVDMWALGVIIYALGAGQLPFQANLKKLPEQRSRFIKRINKGLLDSQLQLISGYQPEFTDLVKELINPIWQDRLSINDTMNHKWLSNNNHWIPSKQESLDAFDLAKVVRQVCGELELTEERLNFEIKSKPIGEAAGFYNILVFERIRQKKYEAAKFSTSSAKRSLTKDHSLKEYNLQHDIRQQEKTISKVCVVGAAHKINEVIPGRKSLQRSIHTSTTSSTPQNTERSLNSNNSGHYFMNLAGGDGTPVPRVGPFKGKNLVTPSKQPNEGSSEAEKYCLKTHTTLKPLEIERGPFSFGFSILNYFTRGKQNF